jgi:hypothetical protein
MQKAQAAKNFDVNAAATRIAARRNQKAIARQTFIRKVI